MDWKKLIERARTGFPLLRSKPKKNETGIALFMVLSAVTILSVLVSEFTYVAQVNARLAFDATDQVKAHYLALTGLKISLLRLKAYQNLRGMGGKGSNLPSIPATVLEQVWKFPFSYPIPKDVPGIPVITKDEIAKFETESGLQGRFTATIESDSNRMNINSALPAYAAPAPSPSASAGAGGREDEDGGGGFGGGGSRGRPNPNPSPTNSADPKAAREQLTAFITNTINQKFKDDTDFAQEYRDLSIEELMDNIFGWIDPSFQPRNGSGRQVIPYKRAPFYSVSELRMIHPIDDGLYQLLAPLFTTNPTTGINVNTLEAPLLRALFPGVTDEEVEEFFKFRDSEEADNRFKDAQAFWTYIAKAFGSVGRSETELKQKFSSQGIYFIVDEETFKITVSAEVNKAMRVIEAWVSLVKPDSNSGRRQGNTTNPNGAGGNGADGSGAQPQNPGGQDPAAANPNSTTTPNIGLKITFMRES